MKRFVYDIIKDILEIEAPQILLPILNPFIKNETQLLFQGYLFIDSNNTTVLNYTLSDSPELYQLFVKVYLSGDIHFFNETTCSIPVTPIPPISTIKEDLELHISKWVINCGLLYTQKIHMLSDIVNNQITQLIQFNDVVPLVGINAPPSINFNDSIIQVNLSTSITIQKKR